MQILFLGGEDFRAYQWMMEMGGVPTEEEYGPYLGQDGYCHAKKLPLLALLMLPRMILKLLKLLYLNMALYR